MVASTRAVGLPPRSAAFFLDHGLFARRRSPQRHRQASRAHRLAYAEYSRSLDHLAESVGCVGHLDDDVLRIAADDSGAEAFGDGFDLVELRLRRVDLH